MIQSGACDSYNLSRSRMVNELEILLGKTVRLEDGSKKEIKGLTDKEKEWFFQNWTEDKSIQSVLSEMVSIGLQSSFRPSSMKKDELINFAKNKLDNQDESIFIGKTKKDILSLIAENGLETGNIIRPCTKARALELEKKIAQLNDTLEDTNTAKAIAEKYYLGISISCSPADDVDNSIATHTCLDIAKCLDGQDISVCAIIDNVKPTKTKKGKNPGSKMCFLTISDSTYSIDHAVIFPDVFEEVSGLCIDGYICLISGYKKNGSFIINKMKKLI